VEHAAVRLDDDCPIFIGMKLDSQLRRQLDALPKTDRKYVSDEDSAFLRICKMGEDEYVGKVVRSRLSTERVDDVRRNVLSILRRLLPDVRLPDQLVVLVCERSGDDLPPEAQSPRAE
jgi:hypothetical protein